MTLSDGRAWQGYIHRGCLPASVSNVNMVACAYVPRLAEHRAPSNYADASHANINFRDGLQCRTNALLSAVCFAIWDVPWVGPAFGLSRADSRCSLHAYLLAIKCPARKVSTLDTALACSHACAVIFPARFALPILPSHTVVHSIVACDIFFVLLHLEGKRLPLGYFTSQLCRG